MGFRVVEDFNRHSSIVVLDGHKLIHHIPLDSSGLSVVRTAKEIFNRNYKELDYDVVRAAVKYLEQGQTYGMTDRVRELLTAISSNQPVLNLNLDADPVSNNQEQHMSDATEEKPVAAKKAAAKKTAPAKKAAAKKATPAAKKAAAKAPAVKRAPKEEAAPVMFKIGDTSTVKRGFLADFVAYATEQKKFTRADLVKKFKAKEEEARLIRYFSYARQHGIFVEA